MQETWHLGRKNEENMAFTELIFWSIAAVVKFLVTPSLMVARGWGFLTTVLVSSVGAGIGVLLFYYFGKWMLNKWAKFRGEKEPKRPFFTSKRRRVVQFRRKFGMWGLLVVSGMISVPISAVLAAKYYHRDERMPWILILAFVIWAFVLTALSYWAVPIV
jgi:membrane protein DedA with SNARE-associated domain